MDAPASIYLTEAERAVTAERVAGRSPAAVFVRVAAGERARRIADPLRVTCGERRLGGGDNL